MANLSAMDAENSKREMEGIDPAEAGSLLELELMRKRASWQRAAGQRKRFLMASIFFLFVVVLAALLAFYFFFSSGRVEELRAQGTAHASPAPTAVSDRP
ncbi:MAG: hypothetical protein ABI871_05420 [Chthoniobacterales bacterium]